MFSALAGDRKGICPQKLYNNYPLMELNTFHPSTPVPLLFLLLSEKDMGLKWM